MNVVCTTLKKIAFHFPLGFLAAVYFGSHTYPVLDSRVEELREVNISRRNCNPMWKIILSNLSLKGGGSTRRNMLIF